MSMTMRIASSGGPDLRAVVRNGASERQAYEGRGESRRPVGRLTDAAGRPVSGAGAVLDVPGVGFLSDATILAPDVYGDVMAAGAVVRLVGAEITARLSGGDFGAIRATIEGVERVEPIGALDDVITAAEAAGSRASKASS